MGWRALHSWLDIMNRQRHGEANPDSWADKKSQDNFAELRAERDRRRGRG